MRRTGSIAGAVLGVTLLMAGLSASAFALGGMDIRGEWVVVAPEGVAHSADFDSVRFTWSGGWIGLNECGEMETGHFAVVGRRTFFWDWRLSHSYFAVGCDRFGVEGHEGVWHWPLLLERVRRYELKGGRLELLDANGRVVVTLARADSG